MKLRRSLVRLSAVAALCTGCATAYPIGVVFTDVKLPVGATANVGKGTKTGEATCKTVLSIVATGDCSIEAAKQQGGITKVYSVDWSANNVLGIYGTYKVVVTGE